LPLLSVHCPMQCTSTALDRIQLHFSVRPVSVRPVTVQPATTAKIVSSVLYRSSPNLEHSFPLTPKKIFRQSTKWAWSGSRDQVFNLVTWRSISQQWVVRSTSCLVLRRVFKSVNAFSLSNLLGDSPSTFRRPPAWAVNVHLQLQLDVFRPTAAGCPWRWSGHCAQPVCRLWAVPDRPGG